MRGWRALAEKSLDSVAWWSRTQRLALCRNVLVKEAARRLLQHGRNELPDLRTPKWRIFLSHFTGIMPGTIIIAIAIVTSSGDGV